MKVTFDKTTKSQAKGRNGIFKLAQCDVHTNLMVDWDGWNHVVGFTSSRGGDSVPCALYLTTEDFHKLVDLLNQAAKEVPKPCPKS